MSGVATSVGSRPWAGLCVTVLVGLLALTAAASAAATTCSGEDDGDCESPGAGGEQGQEPAEGAAPAAPAAPAATLALEVVPVAGDGPEDGDLVIDEGTGLAWLAFSPDTPSEQHAVYEFRVRNTGEGQLRDVTVTDERAGTVLAADAGTVLAPGEEVAVRAAMAFTFEEVATGLGGLFTSQSSATAIDAAGTTVTATATTTLELVAVLGTPTVDLAFAVVPDVGDVVGDDPPTVRWTAGEAAADDVRVVRHRITVTNTSTVDLEQVEVAVDVLATPLVTASDGVALAPGEEWVGEFDRELHVGDVGDVGGSVGRHDLVATATVTATATGAVPGQTATARGEVVVQAIILADEGAEVLPAAGLRTAAGATLALLLLGAGGAMVTAGRSPASRRGAR